MTLNGKDLEELIDAIISAYPRESDLEKIVRFDLNENLSQISSGDNYDNLVFNLITQWAEPQGKLDDLIKASHKRNPNNLKLKEFYNRYYPNNPNILEKIGCSSDNSSLISIWNEVYEILNKNNLINDQLLTKICRETLQNTTNDLSGNCLELDGDLNLIQLREILINKFPKRKDDVPTIVEFAERLSSEVSQDLSIQLIALVKNIAKKLDIPLPTYNYSNYYFLLLVVAHKIGEEQFRLTPELLSYNSSGNYKRCVGTELGFADDKPIKCNLKEITGKIGEIIQKCLNLQLIKSFPAVQLFINCEYLGYAFDSEKIVIDPDRKDTNCIGIEYPFLVSPYERFTNPRHYLKFKERWNDLQSRLTSNLINLLSPLQDVSIDIEKKYFETLANKWQASRIVGLKILGCWHDDQKIHDHLFYSVVKSGIPLVIWVRYNHLPDCEEQLDKLLNYPNLNNCHNLFNKVHEIRQKSYYEEKEKLGCYLGILADDPRRVPAVFREIHH